MALFPAFPPASPDDVLDYPFSFLALLEPGETLAEATLIIAPNGLAEISLSVAGAVATARITGGVSGTRYLVACAVATSFGRVVAGVAPLVVGPVGLDDPNLATPAPAEACA